jgi:hypothetical protein
MMPWCKIDSEDLRTGCGERPLACVTAAGAGNQMLACDGKSICLQPLRQILETASLVLGDVRAAGKSVVVCLRSGSRSELSAGKMEAWSRPNMIQQSVIYCRCWKVVPTAAVHRKAVHL